MKGDDMGWTYNTHFRDAKNTRNFSWKTWKESTIWQIYVQMHNYIKIDIKLCEAVDWAYLDRYRNQ
jgi:hypothetical protein